MYAGDYALGQTIDLKFTTRRFSTGAPFTLAGTPAVAAYEDNSLTEITAGITLTVDFDARTGLNNVRVVASGANGYAAGKSYALVITAGTVDAVSVVGEVVGMFTLERGAAFARLGAPAGASVAADIATRATPAQVNAEVVDALDVDTYAEIGQETPAATQTIRKMVAFLYKAWRNRSTQTASQYALYGDDAVTVHQKATFSDDGTTADRGEAATGP